MSTHGGPKDIPLLDSVISNAVTPGSDVSTALSTEDREDISLLFLEVREFPIAKQLFSSPHVPLVGGVQVPVAFAVCKMAIYVLVQLLHFNHQSDGDLDEVGVCTRYDPLQYVLVQRTCVAHDGKAHTNNFDIFKID